MFRYNDALVHESVTTWTFFKMWPLLHNTEEKLIHSPSLKPLVVNSCYDARWPFTYLIFLNYFVMSNRKDDDNRKTYWVMAFRVPIAFQLRSHVDKSAIDFFCYHDPSRLHGGIIITLKFQHVTFRQGFLPFSALRVH